MRKHPLIAFFVLAYLLTWWIYPLLRFSPLLGIPGLFGPALAAIIMAAVTGGRSAVKQLLSRVVIWRVAVRAMRRREIASSPGDAIATARTHRQSLSE